jgi:hypothetical protein
LPGPTSPDSLATVKRNIGLGYGDAALIGQHIMRCLEYELALRDARLDALEAQSAARGEES